MQDQQRHLAAILFTDIVGYTAMMQQDESLAMALVKHYLDVLKKTVSDHSGQVLNDYGDGSLCTFPSATRAVTCAISMQQQLQTDPIVPLRIGLHIGELFFEEGKVFGDGVNVASRIQSLGQANTILFSKEIYDKIRNQPGFKSVSLGMFEFKNVDDPIEVFALANDGLIVPKKEEISGKLKEIKQKSGRTKWLLILSAVIVLSVAAIFIFNYLNHKKGFSVNDRSIVVLPFDNYSNDPEQENFINGITDEITTQLAKIADIKVIGRTSASLYKKSKKPLDQMGEVLGVAAYLEGSVLKEGNKIRINAQLINANTQEHIWADHYDRDLKDIFSMQSEVASNIAEQLHARLTEEERNNINKKPTDNIEAYKYYRRGRFFWDTRTKVSFDSAEENYKRAIALDPEYALAYSGLADLYIYNLKGLSQEEAIPIARDFANKALSLDSTLSEALTTIGFIQSAFDYDWTSSKRTLEKAIRFNRNYPTAHLFYGNLLLYTGENMELGIKEVKTALALDPLSTNVNYALGRNYYCARKYDSAFVQLKKTLALKPDNNFAIGNLVYVLLTQKNYPEAFEVIKKLGKTGPSKLFYYQTSVLSYAYGVSGDKVNAKKELEKSLSESPDQSPYFIAQDYIILNDYNEALNRLEQAYKSHDLWMYILKVDPALDPIRNEPRFKELMKKMNLG
jgi:TolB-like protein/class 3 adenylate cyclase/Tfp pilus assembly protein PilF